MTGMRDLRERELVAPQDIGDEPPSGGQVARRLHVEGGIIERRKDQV